MKKRDPVFFLTHKRSARLLYATGGAAIGLVALLSGCSASLESTDDEIAALIQRRTENVGGNQVHTPRRAGLRDVERPLTPQRPTLNPSPNDLRFTPAAEARDVATRLEGYTATALGADSAATPLALDLEGAFRTAQLSARDYLNREEDSIIAAISLLLERHQWSPRFFNDTAAQFAGQGTQGRFEHALSIINTLRATKKLPYGGTVEAQWVTAATQQLRDQTTGRYVQSSRLSLATNVPLLQGSGDTARESLVQAERELIYDARSFERFRRQFLVQIATEYFGLLQAREQIVNQERQLTSLKKFAEGSAARVAAGRISEFERAIADNQVLSATAALASLRESYILALDRYKIRLGLPLGRPISILPLAFDIAEPSIDLDEASRLGLEYRLDLQNSRDRVEDAQRGVANARNLLLPRLDLTASAGVPTPPNERVGGVSFSPEDLNYSAGLLFSLPLDRKSEALALRTAMIRLEQSRRSHDKAKDDAVVEIRGSLRSIDLARFRLTLAERAVEINQRRLEEQKLKIDKVTPQSVIDSENELLNAENARDRNRTDLRVAILNYLLATDQLRVAPDGAFVQLPGMERANAPTLAPTPTTPP